MTERLGRGNRQKGVARITLGLVLAITTSLVVGAFTSGMLPASAQNEPSPTATETTAGGDTSPSSPTAPAGSQIQFLNPSKYAEPEYISIKPDADGWYHLVAWVSQPPSDAVVTFEVQTGSGPARTIRDARTGSPTATRAGDTFEMYWDLEAEGQQVPNGEHVLRALLFSSGGQSPASPASPSPSGATVVSSDEENVTVDRTSETVEILDPANPGRIGVYDPDNDPSSGNRRPGFTMLVQTSDGADHVRAFYSTAPPGSEPSWTTCSDQVTVSYDDRTRRIGCTIPEDQSPSEITAVAAVVVEDDAGSGTPAGGICTPPLCTPPSEHTESGDAHRVTSVYNADPRSVVLTGSGTGTRNACHEMTATVLDQFGRPVWRANADVHAEGPADSLQFAVTERTSNFSPPTQGGHTRTEPAWDCEAGSAHSSRQQAEHELPGDDRKHIETVANEGTDLEGEFRFALRSTVAGPGESTLVEAWADEDDDDVNDSDTAGATTDPRDPQATRTINWVVASPSSPASPAQSSGSPSSVSPSSVSPSSASPSSVSPSSASPSSASPSPSPTVETLNCDPETDTNPVRSGHTILCRVTRGPGSPSPNSGSLSGIRVHAEATGANDPDGGENSPGSPDFTCVTDDNGTCVFTHGPGGAGNTNNIGTTLYRAWIDSNASQVEADLTEGRDESQQPGQKPEPDDTDVVEKTWQRAPLDCDPERDGNPTGTSHTVTCRAAAPAGGTSSGTQIDAEATGVNDPDGSDSPDSPDFTCTTDANGTCTFTHGPGGSGTTNVQGVTTYRAWIDADSSNSVAEADMTEGRNEGAEPGTTPESDETDVVDKTWTRTPTAVTMTPESDTASVGSCNAFTVTVTGDNSQPVDGVLVDVEQRHDRAGNQTANDEPRVAFCTPRADDGPNPSGVDQTQGDLDPPDENPDNAGTAGGETLTPTDAQGRVTIGIAVVPANGSDGAGNVVVTAFFETDDDDDPETGEPQDSSTKTWIAAEGRTIVCQPETATNPVNTQHTVTCTVNDRFGAPVEGEGVTFTEDGPGDFTSRGTRTNASGRVVAVTSSSQPGTQSITATLDDDLQGGEPGETDECDQPAGTPAGSPAGSCSDTVTKTWTAVATTAPPSSPSTFGRTVTLETQKPRVGYNGNVTLGGTVETDEEGPESCVEFVEVTILRDVLGGADEFETFATVQTDANGAYSHSFKADVSANYVAQVDEVLACAAATSEAVPVLVKVKVALKLSKNRVRKGGRVRFTIRTAPCPDTAGDKVLLFRAIDGKFGKTGKKRTNDSCRTRLSRRIRSDSVFQARWPKQAEEFLAGKSRPKVVRVRGR